MTIILMMKNGFTDAQKNCMLSGCCNYIADKLYGAMLADEKFFCMIVLYIVIILFDLNIDDRLFCMLFLIGNKSLYFFCL